MRKRTVVTGLLAIVLSIYFWIAFSKTRGLEVYTISYTMGKIFVMTYFPALLLALILWLFFILAANRELRITFSDMKAKREEKKVQKQEKKNAAKEDADNIKNVCPNCGEKAEKGNKFCIKCGTELK